MPKHIQHIENFKAHFSTFAPGIKLAQEVYDASNALTQKTDYLGGFIYENDELQLIQHEEGLIVPDATTGNYDYEYRIADHLGNTRVMFTTNPKTITFTANYEGDPNNPDDQPLFEEVQIGSEGDFNHTTGNPNYTHAQVFRSSPHNQVGSAIAIPVGEGDKIAAVVFAKYIAAAEDPGVSPVTIASALVSAFTGGASSGTEGGAGTINNNFGGGSLIGGTGFPLESGTAPKAFLNLMFLPDGDPINLVKDASFAYDQVADGATEAVIDGVSNSPFDELRIENFVVPGQGYVMVYVSNEGSLTDVYFDDITITVEEHPVIEKTDYYPYGMQMAGGYQRITTAKNNFLYNGFELQTDLDWGVYDYLARYYDPSIGRFLQVDPAADLMRRHSPYNYAFDNPIRFIDPDGMMPHSVNGEPPEWLKAISRGFEQLGQEFAKLGKDIGGAAAEVWDGLGEAIDNAPKESTTEQAVGDGVDIQDQTSAGPDSRYVATADASADNVVMEKEFLDGLTAGAKALKVGPADDIGVSAQKVATAIKTGSSAVEAGKEVFSTDTPQVGDQVQGQVTEAGNTQRGFSPINESSRVQRTWVSDGKGNYTLIKIDTVSTNN